MKWEITMARRKGSVNGDTSLYRDHPLYSYFMGVVQRGRGVGSNFDFNQSDFDRFVEIMGPIPEDMEWPTVGRYNHDLGYVWDESESRWNFRWQEKSDNSKESSLRNKLGTDPEHNSYAGQLGGGRTAELGKTTFQRASSEQQSEFARRSIESPNHINKQSFTCRGCGETKRGAQWKSHCDNLKCQN